MSNNHTGHKTHAAAASHLLKRSKPITPEDCGRAAQAHALLAIAEQLRIANLSKIAMMEDPDSDPYSTQFAAIEQAANALFTMREEDDDAFPGHAGPIDKIMVAYLNPDIAAALNAAPKEKKA